VNEKQQVMLDLLTVVRNRFKTEKVEITGAGAKGLVVTIRSKTPINVCDTRAWLQREGYAVGEVIWLRVEEKSDGTITRLQKELADAKDMLSDAIENFISRRLSHELDDLQEKRAEALRQCEAERNREIDTVLYYEGLRAEWDGKLKAERTAHEETKRKLELVRNDRNREIDTARAVTECLRAERAAHEETRQLLKERLRAMGGNGRLYIEEKAAHEETRKELELTKRELRWNRAIDRHL